MKLENRVYRLTRPTHGRWLQAVADCFARELGDGAYPLRFSIVKLDGDEAAVEATVVTYEQDDRFAGAFEQVELLTPRRKQYQAESFGVVQIVPTGIGCELGGYAGDACPATNLLASAADFVVTHPNAVNASELNEMADNVLYVEGKSLDDFLLGHLALLPVRANTIATFIDPTGLDYLDYVVNTLNAARAVKGVDCREYAVLPEDLGVEIEWSPAGCAVGTVGRPDIMLDAVQTLIDGGADAVGGVSVIAGVTKQMFDAHMEGGHPNPSGGVEAIITHLISKVFRMPTAHAPLPYYQDIKDADTANPRAAAEFISTPHYFCVLKGLAKAPRLTPIDRLDRVGHQFTTLNDIGAVVMPASALGGLPALAAEYNDIPLIAVSDNRTVLEVDNQKMRMANVVRVDSYLEAAGVVLALKQGISLESLRRPLSPATRRHLASATAEHPHDKPGLINAGR